MFDFRPLVYAFWVLLCLLPLALWKLGELAWWVVTRVRVTW